MATVLPISSRVRVAPAIEAVYEKKVKKKDEVRYNYGRATGVKPGIVTLNPKPSKGLASKVIDCVEKFMLKLMHDHGDLSNSRPLHYLTDNYAPVPDETPPVHDIPVTGYLPECLNGMFMRIGPNPRFSPVAGYHWFDGDGMIHGLRIKNRKATYVSRFVKTSRLMQEEYFGCAKFGKIGDLKGPLGVSVVLVQALRAIQKVIDVSYGFGTGNTALVYHNKNLLALYELDKPYLVKVMEDGDLQTLGIVDYDKRLTHAFAAHPKIDPVTGEMFTFGCSLTRPYVTYRVISKDGFMHDPVVITIPESTLMHDFAITENYAIFMDLPMYFRPVSGMVMEKKMAYVYDPTKKARFGILSRYAKTEHEIRWFELPSCFIFHNANAWEEGNEVVLITSRCENPDLEMFSGYLKDKVIPGNFRSELYEMRFNMETGLSLQKKLSESIFDFTEINSNYIGRKQRYVYGTIADNTGKTVGVAKFDLHAKPEEGKQKIEVGGNVKGIFRFGAGRFGSEAVFVPREHGTDSLEDDGYLISFVHDENIEKSFAYVIDAKTMSADPIAVVHLPKRVPYGFHAMFMTEEQIQQQERV